MKKVVGIAEIIFAVSMVILHYSTGYIPDWWVAAMWCGIAGINTLLSQ